MSTARRVAFLCLGVMGGPMAGHLARAGHSVVVYNRTRERAVAWAEAHSEYDVSIAETPAEAAADREIVFACSGADPDLRQVALGERDDSDHAADADDADGGGPGGAIGAMSPGSVFVDHTTASATLARQLASAADARGVGFLDAPVSGGQAGAEQGALTIMVGGEEATYRQVAPILDHYAKKHLLMGPVGHGQLTKMVNQICIAGLVQALSEGLHFAAQVGLDPTRVVEVISQGAAGSWQMENRAHTMIEGRFDFGFAVDWMRKDLAMAMEEAQRLDIPLPITQQVDARYEKLQARGAGRLDTSSLILELAAESDDGD